MWRKTWIHKFVCSNSKPMIIFVWRYKTTEHFPLCEDNTTHSQHELCQGPYLVQWLLGEIIIEQSVELRQATTNHHYLLCTIYTTGSTLTSHYKMKIVPRQGSLPAICQWLLTSLEHKQASRERKRGRNKMNIVIDIDVRRTLHYPVILSDWCEKNWESKFS